jgi:hypothetical protein
MPKTPMRARPEARVALMVPMRGALKNQILDAATAAGMSLTQWVTHAVHQQLHHGNERPPVRVLPTASEVVADYLAGRTTLAPCGERYPCAGADDVEHHGALAYCGRCHLRVG